MPRYIIYVDVEVEADSAVEAEDIAMKAITGDLEWSVSEVAEVDE